jgi:GT2 family glycosyltransferase
MRIGVAVVHFRFWPDVAATFDALLGQTRPPDHVVVFDDCSADGSVDRLRAAYPDLEVHVAPHNRGVIANFNAGFAALARHGVDAVLTLTHETLLEPDALEKLAGRLESDPRLGQVGPLIGFLSAPDVVFSAGGAILSRTWENPHIGMYEPLDAWRGRAPHRVAWLDGACTLVRAEALAQAGPLDERFFHYYDDVLLGVRLNQLGWRVECVPAAVARQQPGELAEYYRVRNRLGFIRATAPPRVLVTELAAYVRAIVEDARASSHGRALAVAQLRAIRDFALGRWGKAPAAYTVARRTDEPTIGGALDEHLAARAAQSPPAVVR